MLFKWITSIRLIETSSNQIHSQNSWLHLLFNVVIGPKADDPISLYQAAFNPGGLIELLKEVRQNNEPILMASHKICSPTVFKQAPNTAITQSFFSLLLLIACILSYLQLKKRKQYIWFDRLLFFLSGIFGMSLDQPHHYFRNRISKQ